MGAWEPCCVGGWEPCTKGWVPAPSGAVLAAPSGCAAPSPPDSWASCTSGPFASSGSRRIQPGRRSPGFVRAVPSAWARPRSRSKISPARFPSPRVRAAMRARLSGVPPFCSAVLTTYTLTTSAASAASAAPPRYRADHTASSTTTAVRRKACHPGPVRPSPGRDWGTARAPLLNMWFHPSPGARRAPFRRRGSRTTPAAPHQSTRGEREKGSTRFHARLSPSRTVEKSLSGAAEAGARLVGVDCEVRSSLRSEDEPFAPNAPCMRAGWLLRV